MPSRLKKTVLLRKQGEGVDQDQHLPYIFHEVQERRHRFVVRPSINNLCGSICYLVFFAASAFRLAQASFIFSLIAFLAAALCGLRFGLADVAEVCAAFAFRLSAQ